MLQTYPYLMKYQNKSVSSNKLSRYKALILDVDGTLVPNRRDGMPSQKVIDSIGKVRDNIHVGLATSRPIFLISNIVRQLKLSGPSIVSGGAQVIDITTNKVWYRQPVEREDIFRVHQIVKSFDLKVHIDTDEIQIQVNRKSDVPSETILGMFIPNVDPNRLEQLRKAIDSITTLSTHPTPSWITGKLCLSVYHAKATKQYGIFEVAKVLGITTHEIIGVGDGENDFPLLMACGLKVAMGNAGNDLKSIADYIAPPIEEDGVADVINKFILT